MKINQIPQARLKDIKVLKEIARKVKACIGFRPKAKEFALKLEKKLSEAEDLAFTAPKIYDIYQKFILLLKFESIDLYPHSQICDLIEKNILEALTLCPNFIDNLSLNLSLFPLDFIDGYLKDWKDVLKRCSQKIGTELLKIRREAKSQPPTVSNWLKDCDDWLGVVYHTDVERATYFTQSPNVRKLSSQDKEVLKRLLCFYDLLKLGVNELGGLGSLSAELIKEKERPLPSFEPLFDPLELLEEKVALPPKPAVVPPVAPPRPPAEIEKEIEAKRKAEEERIARLEREMRPKVAPPPPVEVPKPEPPIPSPRPEIPKPEVAPSSKIKPAPSFPKPSRPVKPPRIGAARPIEPIKPLEPVPSLKPKAPVRIESVDDVKKLSVSDFRDYAEVPKDAARAILEKINSVLVSPLDKIKALSSWKESDLYKLYIEMGRESMAQDKSVKELADERKVQSKAYLTHEEFEAIAEISGAIG